LRRVLLFGVLPLAAYGLLQRLLPLPAWDRNWLDVTEFTSIGASDEHIRVYGPVNSPGTLASLLAVSLLCYLTVRRHPKLALLGAGLVLVALSLTFARSAWVALMAAGAAHIIASNGRSARLVLGAAAFVVAVTLVLAPFSGAASDVITRFNTIWHPSEDTSATSRQATFSQLLPEALSAPLGHGLGTAGEPTKLSGDSDLRAPDNGYLGLMYQVGPIGFLFVIAALSAVTAAAWRGARDTGPNQEMRLLLFALLVCLLVQLAAGDAFYGVVGVILWFIGGQALAYDLRRRPPAT
jgi:O-antigen ligase